MQMTIDQYCKTRLKDQMDYYDRQAARNKKWFQYIALLSLVSSTAIPVLAITGHMWPVGILGAVTSVAIAARTLFKWRENWLKFRKGHQDLSREKFLCATRTGPYAGKEDEELLNTLTARVEEILVREHEDWQEVQERISPSVS